MALSVKRDGTYIQLSVKRDEPDIHLSVKRYGMETWENLGLNFCKYKVL